MKPQILQNISLKSYNTFGINCTAKNFVEVKTLDELLEVLEIVEQESFTSIFILGGGSNVLFLKDFDGLIIKNSITGIEKVETNDTDSNKENIILYVSAGENWHQFVLFCLENNYGGVENLSLIPGTVGAAPMQNIGAYGVEIRNVVERVKVIDRQTKQQLWISNSECQFGYRTSIFKTQAKDKYIIIGVEFRLTKQNHILNISYGAIQESLKALNLQKNQIPTINQISKAIIEIRESKLPNPKEIGNGGSFFKNPEIPTSQFEELKREFSTIVGYPISEQITKVPAGWLIESCGWKGKVVGNTGAHKNQALVLVNYGNAKGKEIWSLAKEIQKSVFDKFGINIEPEINVVG